MKRPDPQHKLSKKAITAWRTIGGLNSLVFWLVPLFYLLLAFGGVLPWWGFYTLGGLALANTILSIFIFPVLRWRHWAYEIFSQEVYLKFGVIIIRKTLIPIARVQHVDTRQGPILKDLGLASVTIYTAATVHEIPCLQEDLAEEIRDQISSIASQVTEDV